MFSDDFYLKLSDGYRRALKKLEDELTDEIVIHSSQIQKQDNDLLDEFSEKFLMPMELCNRRLRLVLFM